MSETRYDSGYCFLCRSHHCVGHDTGISDAERAAVPAPVGAETREGALLPCPFCGADANLTPSADECGVFTVYCTGGKPFQRCQGAMRARAKDDAIRLWNRRALPAAASASEGATRYE